MRVLVIGSNGQLGQELIYLSKQELEIDFLPLSKAALDITNQGSVDSFFKKEDFDYIINCAAYTKVNDAEKEIDKAFDVNKKGVKNLVKAIIKYSKNNCRFIHISTDYVFDGSSSLGVEESYLANPLNVYGQSKLEGEFELQNSSIESIIIRTSWLYSAYGENFVKTIAKKALTGESLRVVDDQVGSPTYARDLAQAIITVIKLHNKTDLIFQNKTIYHFSNNGSCSWFEFAEQIISILNSKTYISPLKSSNVNGCLRPKNSVLLCKKFEKDFNYVIPNWKDSLTSCISSIQKNK